MRTQRGHGELGILVVLAVAVWSLALTGCAGPLLLGLKQYKDKDGGEWNFITGADFTIGANGLDSVSNNRGIEPDRYKKQ